MTDTFNDKDTSRARQDKSFKEQILEEMQEASRQREERLAYEERLRQETALAAKQAEEARFEAMHQARLADEADRLGQEDVEEEWLISQEEQVNDLETLEREELDRLYEAERALLRREFEQEESLSETAIPDFSQTVTLDFDDLDLADEGIDPLEETKVMPAVLTEPPLPQAVQPLSDKINFDDDLFADESLEQELEDYIVPQDTFRQNKRQATSSLAKKLTLFLASLIVLLILATGALGVFYVSSALGPLDKASTDYIQVEIPSGSGNKLIGKILEEQGVIKSGTVFNYYTKFKNYTNFQSGYYNFQKSMSLAEISALLQEGGTPEPVLPALGKIVIPEGYTLDQIATAVASNGQKADKAGPSPFKSADFLALVQNPEFIGRMAEKYPNLFAHLPEAGVAKYQLEGYLYPATYSYYENSTLEGLVEEMIAAMDANLAPYYGEIAEQGMTVNEILTLASLVEKEGESDDDRKQIASVFYNRLQIDMPLQSNIAILYAMGKLGEATTLAEDAAIDTAIDSPYNIYTNIGLMPGPVDSPSLRSIQAVIQPAQTDYLYFVADVTTKVVYFAETYEEHEVNVETYVNSHLD